MKRKPKPEAYFYRPGHQKNYYNNIISAYNAAVAHSIGYPRTPVIYMMYSSRTDSYFVVMVLKNGEWDVDLSAEWIKKFKQKEEDTNDA